MPPHKGIQSDELPDHSFGGCAKVQRVVPSRRIFYSHMKQSFREIKTKKVNFFLGCLSCFVVVFVVALMNTLLGNAPIVFLRLGELTAGEIDVSIHAKSETDYRLVNYTQLVDLLADKEEYTLHSPRQYGASAVIPSRGCGFDPMNLTQRYLVGIFNNAFNLTDAYIKANATTPPGHPVHVVFDQYCQGMGDVDITNCLFSHCSFEGQLVEMMAIDTNLERKAGIGQAWPFDPMPANKAILHQSLADQLQLGVGDTVLLAFDLKAVFPGLSDEILLSMLNSSAVSPDGRLNNFYWDVVFLYYEIMAVYDDPLGKHNQDNKYILVEYESLVTNIVQQISPMMPTNVSAQWAMVNHFHYAGEVYMNLPHRQNTYLQTDYDAIQEEVVRFAGVLTYRLGAGYLDLSLPVLGQLRLTQFLALFLGLVLNIVVIVLLALSVLLIYSLLMVNVETRTFELGVLRMIGMTRVNIVHLLLIQSFAYAVPSILVGIPAAQLAMLVLAQIFLGVAGVPISAYLDISSVCWAAVLGLVIPMLSSILPIWSALTSNLRDSLDTKRPKVQAVQVKLERSEDSSFSLSLLLLGASLALFGFGVYYVFPLALMTFSLSLLLDMFFFLLLAMMLGLVILSLNLQHLLERLIVTILLFWESNSVRTLTAKNLVGHKRRNRKTTVMYALALGFIIFIVVSYQSSIAGFLFAVQQNSGCFLQVEFHDSTVDQRLLELETVVQNHSIVDTWSYKTPYITEFMPEIEDDNPKLNNLGRTRKFTNHLWAVSPNFYDATLQQFIVPYITPGHVDGMRLSEQLYTVGGSSKAILGAVYNSLVGLDLETPFVYTFEHSNLTMRQEWFYQLKPLALMSLSPAGLFSNFPAVLFQDAIVSIPTYMRMSKHNFTSVLDVPQSRMQFKLNLPDPPYAKQDSRLVKALIRDIEAVIDRSTASVWNYDDIMGPVNTANNLLMYFFGFITVIAMGIASFSLVSSMYTNVHEQQQEIGVLRAVGADRTWVNRVFIYEAFTLVLASSLLGTVIGTVVSYSLNLQRALVTQLPIPFVFPWEITVLTFIASMLLALVASFLPTRSLLTKPATALMR